MQSRRHFLKGSVFASGTFLLGLLTLSGCHGPESTSTGNGSSVNAPDSAAAKDACDITALTPADLAARTSLGYVDKSPMREKKCRSCKLFLPPGSGKTCGGCSMFKGPIAPAGYCTYWAAKI